VVTCRSSPRDAARDRWTYQARSTFHHREEARAWTDTANLKRPWRADFLAAIAQELSTLRPQPLAILELGSGPGFLAAAILEQLPGVSYTLLDYSPVSRYRLTVRILFSGLVTFIIGVLLSIWGAA
jgi:hypothetical protein